MQINKVEIITEILHRTKEEPRISQIGKELEQILKSEGIQPDERGVWALNREDRIHLAIRAIEFGAIPEQIIGELTWKDFEGLIAAILKENGFYCIESFRRRGNGQNRGMEIDVIGIRGRNILSIDAKMWGVHSGKNSALQAAAEKQKERSKRLADELPALREKMGQMDVGRYYIIPVLITWLVEDIDFHEGVPIVPVFKFNSFVLQLEEFEDMLYRVNAELEIQ